MKFILRLETISLADKSQINITKISLRVIASLVKCKL